MSKITNEQVKHVAHLARLEITEEEATKFSAQLEAILNFADQLEEVDTEGQECPCRGNVEHRAAEIENVEDSCCGKDVGGREQELEGRDV